MFISSFVSLCIAICGWKQNIYIVQKQVRQIILCLEIGKLPGGFCVGILSQSSQNVNWIWILVLLWLHPLSASHSSSNILCLEWDLVYQRTFLSDCFTFNFMPFLSSYTSGHIFWGSWPSLILAQYVCGVWVEGGRVWVVSVVHGSSASFFDSCSDPGSQGSSLYPYLSLGEA